MKARTPEEFITKVSRDLAWRKKELSDHRIWVQTSRNDLTRSRAIRAALPMVYAHWEGFVRFSASLYVDYVAIRRLRCRELSSNFLALFVRDQLSSGKRDLFREALRMVSFLLGPLEDRLEVKGENVINTRSNLGSTVLREILEMLGLDYAPYELKAKLLDTSLLQKRNRIAHGHNLELTEEAYLEIHEEMVNLMQVFQEQLEEAVVGGYYKAKSVA